MLENSYKTFTDNIFVLAKGIVHLKKIKLFHNLLVPTLHEVLSWAQMKTIWWLLEQLTVAIDFHGIFFPNNKLIFIFGWIIPLT